MKGGLQILERTTVAGFERKSRLIFCFCNFLCPVAVFFFSFSEGGLQIYNISCSSGLLLDTFQLPGIQFELWVSSIDVHNISKDTVTTVNSRN